MRHIRIGSGAGYSGDRIDPAVELAEQGSLDYLVFECLAERTIALAQKARRLDPAPGLTLYWKNACARSCPCAPAIRSASSPTWARPTRWAPWNERAPSPVHSASPG